jgi:hypothetical protein
MGVTVERPSAFRVTARVAGPGGDAPAFGIADLCERERDAVRDALTAAAATRFVPAEEAASLVTGASDGPAVFGAALERAARALAADGGARGVEPLTDLLDLFVLRGWTVPYDAQTAFWRWWSALAPEQARAHGALARRLGFAAEES